MNGRDDGLVWLRARIALAWLRLAQRTYADCYRWDPDLDLEDHARLYAAPAVLSVNPDYVGRHHIPGDGVTTLRLMDVDGSGDVVGVRYVEDYHVTGEVSAA